MGSETEQEVVRLERSLWRSRIALAALVTVNLAILVLVLRRPALSAASDLDHADVLADVHQAEGKALSDQEKVYFSANGGEVYVHVMAAGQSCPFHLHTTSDEVVLIVSGGAQVSQSRVSDGGLVMDEREVAKNALVESPVNCGHAFVNRDRGHVLANLVFTMPSYDGNLYVAPSDPRLLTAAAPTSFNLDSERQQFVAGGAPLEERALPVLGGRLGVVQVRGRTTLPAVPGEQVIYTWGGAGTLQAGKKLKLDEGVLAVVPANLEVTLQADPAPLSVLVFAPGGDHPSG